jgi:signal transduction histidine kinase
MTEPTRRDVHLEVHPSVVFKLGEDLISDDGQALAELAKNSYDADATFARISVDTLAWFHRQSLLPASQDEVENWMKRKAEALAEGKALEPAPSFLQGQITVTDNGTGMSFEAIRDGWLTVSSSAKRQMKAAGIKTQAKRTPLGDKGLGRLGVQRLGEITELASVPRVRYHEKDKKHLGDHRLKVTIDWQRFANATKLSSVPVSVEEQNIDVISAGSVVRVVGLRNPGFWTDVSPADLDREVITLVSPYENAEGFRLTIRVNGDSIDVRERARVVLESAPIAYDLRYTNRTLEVRGQMAATELRGITKESIAFYERWVAPDNGAAFATWLFEKHAARAKEVGLEDGDDLHFLRFSMERGFAETRSAHARGTDWADPGAFVGAVSSIDMRAAPETPFASTNARREFAKSLRGIKVYRNGFGIRLADDWLNLAKRWTEGSSYYNLRPDNTLGFINLSVEENSGLEETTSREQFRDTPAWRGFYGLLSSWADWTERVQAFIRRSFNEYRREIDARNVEISPDAGASEIAEALSSRMAKARKVLATVESNGSAFVKWSNAVEGLRQQRDRAAGQVFSDPAIAAGINEALVQIESARDQSERLLIELRPLISEYEHLQAGVRLLETQLDVATEQIGQAWEAVAAGLTAETLSHEVAQISDRLISRSAQIKQFFRTTQPPQTRGLAYAEYVRSAATELTRHVARLDPALRYRRERRELLDIAKALSDVLDYHRPVLERDNILVELNVERNFELRINRGKFTQIFDNLILNSAFWIRSDRKTLGLDRHILITVKAPSVLISDSGPGVNPAVQESLFEPFVTMKPHDQGRGLGLFVVRQLLESEDGAIELMSDRNDRGRRYVFRATFEPVAADKSS